MEIKTRKELDFVIKADYMMNRGYFSPSFKKKIISLFAPDYVMDYVVIMRKINYLSYLSNASSKNYIAKLQLLYYKLIYYKLGVKLSFSIGPNALGYGCVIPHYGSLGIGNSNRLGNYCVIHTLTSITDNGKIIGDALYLSKGAKITSRVNLGDNVSVAANSVVNKSFTENDILLAGMPAQIKIKTQAWYLRDGKKFSERVRKVEELKLKMNII